MVNGTTTRSPFLNFVTAEPTSSTMPIGSWPRTSPASIVGMNPSYRCRSDPQMAVDVIFTMMSPGSSILRVGDRVHPNVTGAVPAYALMEGLLFVFVIDGGQREPRCRNKPVRKGHSKCTKIIRKLPQDVVSALGSLRMLRNVRPVDRVRRV